MRVYFDCHTHPKTTQNFIYGRTSIVVFRVRPSLATQWVTTKTSKYCVFVSVTLIALYRSTIGFGRGLLSRITALFAYEFHTYWIPLSVLEGVLTEVPKVLVLFVAFLDTIWKCHYCEWQRVLETNQIDVDLLIGWSVTIEKWNMHLKRRVVRYETHFYNGERFTELRCISWMILRIRRITL